MNHVGMNKLYILGLAIFLGVLTVGMQIHPYAISNAERFAYIETGPQMLRHEVLLDGQAGNPWQYRVLAPYLAEGLLQISDSVGVPRPALVVFIGLRILQNIVLFGLAYIFYNTYLKYDRWVTTLGLLMLAWGSTHSGYGSDLSHNTYFDVIFYLIAAILIFEKQWPWFIVLTSLAALNRETSGLIPLMGASALYFYYQEKSFNRHYLYMGFSMAAFAVIFIGLRLYWDIQGTDERFGLFGLTSNLQDPRAWMLLAATLGVTPLFALVFYQQWHPLLKLFFWLIVPIWVGIHLFTSIIAETRLFLVPYALVLIPAALSGFRTVDAEGRDTAPPKVA